MRVSDERAIKRTTVVYAGGKVSTEQAEGSDTFTVHARTEEMAPANRWIPEADRDGRERRREATQGAHGLLTSSDFRYMLGAMILLASVVPPCTAGWVGAVAGAMLGATGVWILVTYREL